MPHIIQYPNPILTTPCVPVPEGRDDIARQVGEDLMAALKQVKRKSVGLSANQIGSLYRVFVLNTKLLGLKTKSIFVNPEIVWESNERVSKVEECMSLPPTIKVMVERAVRVRLVATTPSGKEIDIELSHLAARCVQHEIEHLNGGTIFDHIPEDQRGKARNLIMLARNTQ